LDRVLRFERSGREFESLRARHFQIPRICKLRNLESSMLRPARQTS
jgi:hypothetical protein